MMQGGRIVYTVEIENGGRREQIDFEGPDGLSDEQITALADNHLRTARPGQTFPGSVLGERPQQQVAASGPIDNRASTWLTQADPMMGLAAGNQVDFVTGAARGAGRVLDNAAGLLESGYNNTLGHVFGQSDTAAQANAAGGGFEGLANNLPQGNQAGETIGEIGAAALLTRGMGGPVTQGAAQGALMSDAETPLGLAGDVALGGAGGYLGDRVMRGIAGVVAPQVPAAARRLHERGVAVSPGQAIPAFRRAEEQLRSRPFVGGQIDRTRQQGYRDFNRVAVEEPIAPYNEFAAQSGRPPIRIPPNAEGHEAIRHVGDELSNRYEAVIPRLRFQADAQAVQEFQALQQTLGNGDMSPAALAQFETIVRNQVMSRVAGQTIDGRAFRQIERNISRQIRRFSRSDAPDDQATAEAFSELQDIMQGGLRRANPDSAAELEALHAGWARLVRVEGAADGAVNGLFSPLQFRRSVRRNDNSTRHRAVARGEALSQQLADDASDVLPSQYPDSGTAGRSQMNPFDPRFYLGALQGALYNPGTQRLITNAAMTPRPGFAPTIADILRGLPAPAAGSAAALGVPNALLGF